MASEHDKHDSLATLVMVAIREGRTRGQFIRQYSTDDDSLLYLQTLSDIYSRAMTAIAADC